MPVRSAQDATLNFQQLQRMLSDSGWQTPVLEHVWKATATPPAYRRSGNVVRLRGRLEGGESGKSAFLLPAGYRPTMQHYQGVIQGGVVMGYVTIETTGEVILATAGEAKPSLAGVTFTVD